MPTLNKLEYLDETKQQIKNALNTNFNSQIQDTDTFRSYVSKINDIYTNWAKVTGEGTALNLTPTKKGRLQSTLKGATSQDGTPTPDTPIPIKVVTGEQNVNISNKNLFSNVNLSNYTISSTGGYVEGTDRLCSDYVNVSNFTNLTMSSITENFFDFGGIAFYDNNKDYISRTTANSVKTLTSSVPTGTTYARAFFQSNGSVVNAQTLITHKIQLEQGSTATDFVSHQQQTYPISLGTLELAEVINKDYIYGTPNNWYKYKYIQKVVYNGTEGWSKLVENTNTTQFIIQAVPGKAKGLYNAMSDLFKTYSGSVEEECITGQSNNTGLQIIINKTRANTSADFKTWLSTHNVTAYYVLNTPTEEQITDTTLIEQLNNLYNATSQDGTTIITCSSASDDNEIVVLNATALMKGGI